MILPIGRKFCSIALTLIVAMGTSTALAQTSADKQYVQELKSKLKSLKQEANDLNKNKIKLDNDLKAIPDEDPKDGLNRKQLNELYQQDYKDSIAIIDCEKSLAQKRKDKAQSTGDVLDQKIDDFVLNLLQSPCNAQAIASLEDCEDLISNKTKRKAIVHDVNILKNYENYCNEIINALEDIHRDLKRAGWSKQEEGSPALQKFDDAWNRIGYRDRFNKQGENIQYLDKRYKEIEDMRANGFENCEAAFEKVIKELTPVKKPFTSPIANICKLSKDIEQLEAKLEAAQNSRKTNAPEIKRLETAINFNESNNKEYNRINNQRKQETEKLNAKKDAIDKVLYDACLYCLDQKHPCDTLGNNEWLRKEVEKLTDAKSKYPQSEDYKKLFSQFNELFNNYEAYTLEIGEFLQNCYKYNKGNGELTNAMRNEINTELKNLKYWKYYSNRNGKNAVHSRNLDYILGEFEAMFNTNFKNCKARYRKLGPMLRGVE